MFIAAQAALPSLVGLWLRRSWSRIVVIVVGMGGLAFVLGAAFDIVTALQAGCFA